VPLHRCTWAQRAVIAALLVLAACAEQTAPTPMPSGGYAEGDSLRMGPMVIVCRADDTRCIPAYAVACSSATERTGAAAIWWLANTAQEQTWCARQGGGRR
jgi:hypothetical protein